LVRVFLHVLLDEAVYSAFHLIFFRNSASSITGIFSSLALVSLLPADSPAIRKLVFLLTLPLTFPPFFKISC
jgi:hypothetical protein